MTLKILTQNALDAFSDPKTTDELITLVDRLRPDAAIFPEAYDADRLQNAPAAIERLASLGYSVTHGLYDDADGRIESHGMVLLIRLELVVADKPGHLTRMGLRNIAEGWLKDPATDEHVHIMGVHLNDRSEAKRQGELDVLLDQIVQTNEPTIIAGDLNALHGQDGHRLVLWPAHFLAMLVRLHLFPDRDPVQTLHQKKTLAWLGSRSRRLSEIASGKTMARFQAAGFTDADARHSPTMPSGRPFAQLDHIMLSQGLRAQSFEVLPKTSSDHLGIMAEISSSVVA